MSGGIGGALIAGAIAAGASVVNAQMQSNAQKKASARQAEGQRLALEQQRRAQAISEQETNRQNKQQVNTINTQKPNSDYGALTGGLGVNSGSLNLGSSSSLNSTSPLAIATPLTAKQKVK